MSKSHICERFPTSEHLVDRSPPLLSTQKGDFSYSGRTPPSIGTWKVASMWPASPPTCWGRCGRRPDSKQREHRGRPPPPQISSSAPALCAPLHPAAWGEVWQSEKEVFLNSGKPAQLLLETPSQISSLQLFLTRPIVSRQDLGQASSIVQGGKPVLTLSWGYTNFDSSYLKVLTTNVFYGEQVFLALFAVWTVEQRELVGSWWLYSLRWEGTGGISLAKVSHLKNTF